MKSIQLFLAIVFLSCDIAPALGCSPIPRKQYVHTEKRVKEKFDLVDSVELMTIVDVKIVKAKRIGFEFEIEVERVVFRVDEVFKGKSKHGDYIVFESSSTCAVSVLSDNRIQVDNKGRITPFKAPRQWLIYRNSAYQSQSTDEPPSYPMNEITNSPMTRPIDQAFGDIRFLRKLQKQVVDAITN